MMMTMTMASSSSSSSSCLSVAMPSPPPTARPTATTTTTTAKGGCSAAAAHGNTSRSPLISDDIRIELSTTSSRQPQHARSSHPISTAVCPSLPFANLLWFNRCYNAQIFVSESEPVESVVRRFRRSVLQSGVIAECRRRRFFETSQEMKKRKQRTAAQRRKTRRTGFRAGDKKDEVNSVNIDDDDDFWGYAEDGADVDL